MDPEIERRLDEIEKQVRMARGEQVESTPWDFSIPSRTDLKDMREQCGLSREEVGQALGYSPKTIQQYESNAAPGRQFIQKALRLYKMEWPRGAGVEVIGGRSR